MSGDLTREQLLALSEVHADDWWLDWLMPATITAAVLWAVAYRLGWLHHHLAGWWCQVWGCQ